MVSRRPVHWRARSISTFSTYDTNYCGKRKRRPVPFEVKEGSCPMWLRCLDESIPTVRTKGRHRTFILGKKTLQPVY
eukprot:368394-Prorocentrum_minimum.AAC.5